MRFFRKSLKPKRRLPLIAVVALILGASQFLLWWFVREAAVSWRDQRSYGGRLAALEQRNKEVQQILADQEALSAAAAQVFPYRHQTPQLVERLEYLADALQLVVEIRNLREDSDKETQAVTPLLVQIEARGSPATLLNYLDAVEHVPELAHVQSWTIALSGDVYRLLMEVAFYLQQDSNERT